MITNEMPKSGQFVAIWRVEGVLFSSTLLWEDGQLMAYDQGFDNWLPECDHGIDTEFLRSREYCVFAQL